MLMPPKYRRLGDYFYLLFVVNMPLRNVTVFDAILSSRQTSEKLQSLLCLYGNPMSNNFHKTVVLKKYEL